MRKTRFIALVVAAVLPIALIGGCGGDDDDEQAADTQTQRTTPAGDQGAAGGAGSRSLTVRMNEYAFEPSDVTIARGGTVTVENAGKISHNLTVEQGPDPKKETKKLAGTSSFLPPKSEKLSVDLKPGKYAMVCTVPGHRQLGMVGSVTVR
jgi:plastocyanin